MICQAVLVSPFINKIGGDEGRIILVTLSLLCLTGVVEFFSTNIWTYILFCMLPTTLFAAALEGASKTWLLSFVPSQSLGAVFSLNNLSMSGIGIISPIYASTIFQYFGGASMKGLVSAVHHLLLTILIAVSLSFMSKKKIPETTISEKKKLE